MFCLPVGTLAIEWCLCLCTQTHKHTNTQTHTHTNTHTHTHSLNMSFQGYAPWTTDLHTYSIDDFLELKSGNKMKYLRSMLADAVSHIKSCPLCQGKGFVCEMCDNANDIIYPFELNKVSSCPGKYE